MSVKERKVNISFQKFSFTNCIAMSLQRDYQALFSYLRSLNFHFLEAWVIECANYYKSSNANMSLEVLKNEVKQQWLLVDLRELKVPSLPPDLKSKEKIILEGKYAVQVETVIDCSQSCYSQFRKLRKISDENIESTREPNDWDVKSKRCLTFGISDGVQEIYAMEYRPIVKIRTNDPELLPGFKMVIMGPVECRRGMILLKDENVRVCGGEVDTLTTSNSLKSILMRKLNLDKDDFQEDSTTFFGTENAEVENVDSGKVASLLSENEDIFFSLPLDTEILAQTGDIFSKGNSSVNSSVSLPSVNRKHNLSAEEKEVPAQKKLSLDPEIGDCSLLFEGNSMDIDKVFSENNATALAPQSSGPQSSIPAGKQAVQTKVSSFFKSDNSVTRTSSVRQVPKCISQTPFVYLKQIMSVKLTKPTIYTIKGIILTLKKKITIEKNEFSLRANITDGSLCVDADFSSDILEDILGFSPCEMVAMIKVKQTNSAIAQRIKESFSKAQEKLISLNCLMDVSFSTQEKPPLVMSLREVTTQHLKDLELRRLREN